MILRKQIESLNLSYLIFLILFVFFFSVGPSLPLPAETGATEEGSTEEVTQDLDSRIDNSQQLIERMEKEYEDIVTLAANIITFSNESALEISIRAISAPEELLRVEYTAPKEMAGQFFILDGDFLYQYVPVSDLVIKRKIKEEELPVRAVNLTPKYLLELLTSEDLEVKLQSRPGNSDYGKDILESEGMPQLDLEEVNEVQTGGRKEDGPSPEGKPFYEKRESYLLEIRPQKEGFGFERQFIWLDAKNLLPQKLVTYLPPKKKGGGQAKILTVVKEVKVNPELDSKELRRLPEDAEIMEG